MQMEVIATGLVGFVFAGLIFLSFAARKIARGDREKRLSTLAEYHKINHIYRTPSERKTIKQLFHLVANEPATLCRNTKVALHGAQESEIVGKETTVDCSGKTNLILVHAENESALWLLSPDDIMRCTDLLSGSTIENIRTHITTRARSKTSERGLVFHMSTIMLAIALLLPTTALYIIGLALIIDHSSNSSSQVSIYITAFLVVAGLGLLSVWWLTIMHNSKTLKEVPCIIWGGVIGGHMALFSFLPEFLKSSVNRLYNHPSSMELLTGLLVVGGGPAILTWIYIYRMTPRKRVK